ncbi:MAG: Eco57I restriction-modification methylase domain-containing protein [Marinilabiliaceae bacterium]
MARIDDFKQFVARYQSACAQGDLNGASEETIRAWINQMLGIFGWDVKNTSHVQQEIPLEPTERQSLNEIGSTNTRPDYTLVNGRVRLFFLDAKKRAVCIKDDKNVAFQIRSYGWSVGAKYSVVTNMDELAVYDCAAMPRHSDNANFARSVYLKVEDYADNFDMICGFLGRKEAIENNANAGFSAKDSIDRNFAEALSGIRLSLAQSIVEGSHSSFSITDLNLWTQIIINRILFIRVCEARKLERDGLLNEFAASDFWSRFKKSSYFDFYEHYDGPMFARIRQIQDLSIDNAVFSQLLSLLYYPSPYCFDVIPLRSISNIYDLFLGYHLEFDGGGQLKNVLKSEFRKSNGAVTTPEPVVDNTIRCTLPPDLLQSLTNEQILHLKFLDPACGSGVFLVSVYDHLLSQIESNIAKRKDTLPGQYLYEKDGQRFLNLEGRKLIINQCLYGVDINQECVEVTKLSLSLKIIDGFNPTDFHAVGLHSSQILQGVGLNIKCGNSIVEPDILKIVPHLAENVEELMATNVFDYRAAFPGVFARGGFDYVIGNPPYVEVKNYNADLPSMLTYIKHRYRSSRNGKIDLAIPFIERGIELLNDHGSLGYIVQKRFFKTDYGKGVRKLLSGRRLLRSVYDYKETDLFDGKITYVAILVCDKSTTDSDTFKYTCSADGNCVEIAKEAIAETPWSFENSNTTSLRVRLSNEKGTLGEVCNIKVGVQALWDDAFHITADHTDGNYIYGKSKICEDIQVERGACRILLRNEHFVPLSVPQSSTFILFPYDVADANASPILFSDFENRYPLAGSYLRKFRSAIETSVQTVPDRRPTLNRDENWHLFTRANNHNAVYKKLCIPMTAQNPQAAVVTRKDAYCDNANMFFAQIPNATDDKLYAMAAFINSTPFAYFAKSIANPQQGGFYKFNKQLLDPVPFPRLEFTAFSPRMLQLAQTARRIEATNSAASANTSSASRLYPLLNNLWDEVDRLCCDLYGLSDIDKQTILSTPRTDHIYG